MNIIKHGAIATVLSLAATHASATTYQLTIDTTLFAVGAAIPVKATGFYDDETGTGSWTMTVELAALFAPDLQYDQTFTMDPVTGIGFLNMATNCGLAPWASGDPTGACAGLAPAFTGPMNATPTPLAAGDFLFSVATAFGVFQYDVNLGSDDPGVQVNLSIADTLLECVDEGAVVNASSVVTLINEAELESLAWSIDGQPVASTQAISEYLTLGQHTLSVVATITTGDSDSDQVTVNVVDTEAPEISAYFIDSRSGEVITTVDTPRRSFVEARFAATDACDNNPQVEGFGGFVLNDGQRLRIQGKKGKVGLITDQIDMKVNAADASGNTSSATTSLTIDP